MNTENNEESWLSNWEQECANSIEEQPNYEQSLITENNNAQTKIWSSFQDSATAVAQLYRGKSSQLLSFHFISDSEIGYLSSVFYIDLYTIF